MTDSDTPPNRRSKNPKSLLVRFSTRCAFAWILEKKTRYHHFKKAEFTWGC